MSKFFLALFLLGVCSVQAQVRLGAVGGYNLSRWASARPVSSPKEAFYTRNPTTFLIGYQAGVVAEVPLSTHWLLSTALLANRRGTGFHNCYGKYDTTSFNVYINSLEIPLSLLYQWPLAHHFLLLAGAGAYASYSYRGAEIGSGKDRGGPYMRLNYVDFSNQNKDHQLLPTVVRPLDVGYLGQLGVARGFFRLLLHYSHGLRDVLAPNHAYTTNFENSQWGLSLVCLIKAKGKQTIW